MYLIVEFQEGDIALVPDCWMGQSGTSAMWPPYKNAQRITSAAAKQEPPSESWSTFNIKRIMYRSEYYDKARRKLKDAEEESDLQTDADDSQSLLQQKRKRVPPKHFSSDESSDESATPPKKSAQKEKANTTSDSTTCIPIPKPPQRMNLGQSPMQSMLGAPMPSVSGAAMRQQLSAPSQQLSSSSQSVFGGIKQILTNQEKIREEISELRRFVQFMQMGPADEIDQLPEEIHLPVTSREEMAALNDFLLEDQKHLLALVKYLSAFCAVTLKASVSRILKELITNEVALMYNLSGTKKKERFSHLQIMIAIYSEFFFHNALCSHVQDHLCTGILVENAYGGTSPQSQQPGRTLRQKYRSGCRGLGTVMLAGRRGEKRPLHMCQKMFQLSKMRKFSVA